LNADVSSSASTHDGDGHIHDEVPNNGPRAWDGDNLNLDDLAESLHGLPFEDMERDIRGALGRHTDEVSVADVLAVLVKVFRNSRTYALDGYEPWDGSLALCDRLTALCDRNFLGMAAGGPCLATDLPPAVVASIYTECGRTFALADHLPRARDRLEKAISVFGIIGDGADEFIQQQEATARASLARVLQRLGQKESAHSQYLLVLKLHASLPPLDDLVELISEYCEIIVDLGGNALNPAVPLLLADLTAEKFGSGSEKHLKVLKDVGEACESVAKLGLAAPVLATRAKLLRAQCGAATSRNCPARRQPLAWATAEAEAAEEEAAQALEVSATEKMQDGDLRGAAADWAEALQFRESCAGPTSDVVAEMRSSLAVLEEAAAAADSMSSGQLADGLQQASMVAASSEDAPQTPQVPTEPEEQQALRESAELDEPQESAAAEESADSDSEHEAAAKSSPAFKPPPRCRLSDPEAAQGLRPAWAAPRASQAPAQAARWSAQGARAADDGWDS